MQKKLFIGVDFSKHKFDVTVLEIIEQKSVLHETFENDQPGYKTFLRWMSKQSKIGRSDWVFCGEHTGLYSRGLSNFLFKKKLTVWLENPLQIKRCSGMKRAKNDRIDSLEIARYAMRYIDKKVDYKPDSKEIEALQLLSAYRKRLVKMKVAIENAAKETRRVIVRDQTCRFIYESSIREIERIKKKIKTIEEMMLKTIINSDLKTNYHLMCSIKGVGIITAVEIMIHTDNFKSFETPRQLACYCGCAPFPNESGTIKKGNRISNLANRELKVLMTQCARSAALYNPQMQKYYQRKKAQGKNDKVVINNIRNKLIHLIFAVVKSGEAYKENYLNQFEKCA
jgi:transposase